MNINKDWAIPATVGVVLSGLGGAVGYILGQRQSKGKDKQIEAIQELRTELEFERADLERRFNKEIQQLILVIRELKEVGQVSLHTFSVGETDETEEEGFDPEPELNVITPEPQVEKEPELEQEDPASTNYTSEHNDRKEAIMSVKDEKESYTLVRSYANPANDGWDWDEELAKRNKNYPYIIHRDEYFNQEEAFYSQDTLTYYAGDDILTDANDVPLYEAKYIVPKLEFGHGSGDPNVCYVRNDKLQAEYEILCEHGTFGQMILGDHVQDLIKKANVRHSLDKFRDDD